MDLTDKAGHGFLVATDQIYAYIQSANLGDNVTGYMRVQYRFKEVTLQEYIGIVQSQQ